MSDKGDQNDSTSQNEPSEQNLIWQTLKTLQEEMSSMKKERISSRKRKKI